MTTRLIEAAIAELTPIQQTAVSWQEGAVLVLAGPGSGKTRVITTRIARILDDSRDRAFRVLALTFTNRAADEMNGRLTALIPDQERRATIGTFHSFCLQVLQQHGVHIGIQPSFTIYSLDADRRELLREGIRRSEGLDPSDDRFLPAIDRLKARLIQPEGCARYFKDPQQGQRVEKVFKAYEAELDRANALDFGSLIFKVYDLVSRFSGIAMSYRRTFEYWLIDEFQDTTEGQYRLIKTLAGPDFKNVFAVADDDQIIYGWNGASVRQLDKFRADFSPELIQLPTNYRCPRAIVEAANRLVSHNLQRTPSKRALEAGKKTLQFPEERHIRLRHFGTDAEEARSIAVDIEGLGKATWGEVALLARTRALLELAQTALTDRHIPSVISQRRDDFASPCFIWLNAVLRQMVRPTDRRNLEVLVESFNRWWGLEVSTAELIAHSDVTLRSYLDEWIDAVPQSIGAATDVASGAQSCARTPHEFRKLVEQVVTLVEQQTESAIDLREDLAAWRDLTRNIWQSVGRDASLELFLQELSLRSKEPPIVAGTVTLTTIHGAKGKEFDHVYLVGVAEDILPSFQSVKTGAQSAEMEEERRNCFVAITRARECLSLSWADRYGNWARKPSRFLREMNFDLPAIEK